MPTCLLLSLSSSSLHNKLHSSSSSISEQSGSFEICIYWWVLRLQDVLSTLLNEGCTNEAELFKLFIFTQPCIIDVINTVVYLLLHSLLLRVEQNGLYFYFPATGRKCAPNPAGTWSSRHFLCIDSLAYFSEGGSFSCLLFLMSYCWFTASVWGVYDV